MHMGTEAWPGNGFVAWGPDGRFLASQDDDPFGVVIVLDASSGEVVRQLVCEEEKAYLPAAPPSVPTAGSWPRGGRRER